MAKSCKCYVEWNKSDTNIVWFHFYEVQKLTKLTCGDKPPVWYDRSGIDCKAGRGNLDDGYCSYLKVGDYFKDVYRCKTASSTICT